MSNAATARAANAAARYRGVQVSTASPVDIVVMLYDGIIRFVTEADAAYETKDRARAGDRIGRAMAIVDELTATIDPEHAPELAENLLALYGFVKRRLFDANLNRDRQALADVVTTLTPMREAWATVAKSSK